MIEPSSIVYVTEYDYLSPDLKRAPQTYHDYWSYNGIDQNWDPDVYMKIDPAGLVFIHEPWRNPTIRIRLGHYDRYERHLTRRGHRHLRSWRESRQRIRSNRRTHKRLRKKNRRMHKRLRKEARRRNKRVFNHQRPRQKSTVRKDRRQQRRQVRSHRRSERR